MKARISKPLGTWCRSRHQPKPPVPDALVEKLELFGTKVLPHIRDI
jgi:hypothetical protein